jgi:TonB family protein
MRHLAPILLVLTVHAWGSGQITSPPAAEPAHVEFSSLRFRHRPDPPPYPPLARIARVQGKVVMGLTLDEKGRVERAEAEDGPFLLRPVAEALCREWRFDPVMANDQPTRVKVRVGIPFRLEDVPDLPGLARAPQVVLDLEDFRSNTSVPVDVALVQAEAKAALAQLGMVQVASSEVDQDLAFHMKLQVQTLRTHDGILIHNVRLRGSLFRDRDLQAEEPGKPVRLIQVGHILAQRGETEFQENVLQTVRRSLRELVVPPAPPPKPERGKAAAAQASGQQPSPSGAAVDFDFSQIKIRLQPPAPPYPVNAKMNRIQGTVVIALTIDPTGRPARAEALEGPVELLMTAIRYALEWEFEPARLNGVPQYARFKLTMPFRLR